MSNLESMSGEDLLAMAGNMMIEQAKETKEEGTKLFQKGDFDAACDMYNKVVDLLEGISASETSSEMERRNLLQASRLNVAACKMKSGDWTGAQTFCSKVIMDNSMATKAWYRRGECSLQLKDLAKAKQDFQKVLELEPDNKAAKNKISGCDSEIMGELRKIEAANMMNAFGSKSIQA